MNWIDTLEKNEGQADLYQCTDNFVRYYKGDKRVELDGTYTTEELEALAAYIRQWQKR